MKIHAIYNRANGVEYHRLIKPLQRMSLDHDVEVTASPDFLNKGLPELKDFDLIVFNRYLYQHTDAVLTYLAQENIPYVVDIDDFWKLPKHHPAYDHYRKNNVAKAIKQVITYADGVTCSTEALAAEIRPLNPKVNIIPNCLDTSDMQWNWAKSKSDKVRFGYVAGVTHHNDMAMIGLAIQELLKDPDYKDRVEFYFCGYSRGKNNEKIKQVESLFTRFTAGNPTEAHKVMGAMTPDTYGEMFAHLDVVLIPLLPDGFNKYKSDIKVQEAAAYGLPIIASDCAPYDEVFENEQPIGMQLVQPGGWVDAMKDIVDNYTPLGLYPRDIEQVNQKRLDFYKSCLKSSIKDRP